MYYLSLHLNIARNSPRNNLGALKQIIFIIISSFILLYALLVINSSIKDFICVER